MFVPLWLLAVLALLVLGFAAWAVMATNGRNPLPFPDRGSRIFAAASPEAKDAVIELLARHGLAERFRFDTDGVLRSILWDGTIINCSSPEVTARLRGATSSIGLVSVDPEASATAAVELLRQRGFSADIARDVEPELPIVFVATDAMPGTVLNFRRHVLRLPRPVPARPRPHR